MPLKFRSKRSAPKRAMVRRRRLARPVRSIGVRQPVHYFKRTAFYSTYVQGSTLSTNAYGLIGQLTQVPGYTEFTALYDQYRIMAMKIRLSPRANSAEAGTNQGLIKMWTAIDYDDNTPITAISDMLQRPNVKQTKSSQEHVRYFKPRINVPTPGIVNTIPGQSSTRGWLDCDNPSIPHYGLKVLVDQLPSGAQSWDVSVTYYLAFKNVV